MSIDIEQEVRSYVEFLDEVLPAITADDVRSATVLGSLGSPTTVRFVPRWYRRPVAVFAAAVVVTILAIAPVVVLGMMDDRSPNIGEAPTTLPQSTVSSIPTSQATTTAPPNPSTTPAVALPPVTTWERIVDEPLTPGEIWAMASTDEVVVAVGDVPDQNDAAVGLETLYTNGVVWVSSDGRSWDRIDDESVFGGDTTQVLWDVIAGPLGFVATGQDGMDAALWFSPDGYAWEKVLVHDLGTPGEADGFAVAAGGPGWVAALDTDDDPSDLVFTSRDGIEWKRTDDQAAASAYADVVEAGQLPLPLTEPPLLGVFWDFAWDGERVIGVCRLNGASIWLSEDSGATWHRVESEQSVFVGGWPLPQTLGVTLFGSEIIVGGNHGGDAPIWIGQWEELSR